MCSRGSEGVGALIGVVPRTVLIKAPSVSYIYSSPCFKMAAGCFND